MGRAGVSAPLRVLAPAARPMIVEYLADLAAGLPCGRSARAAIVAEVGDGLLDAVQARIDTGEAPVVAARMAVAEFGDARALAAGFASGRGNLAALVRRRALGTWNADIERPRAGASTGSLKAAKIAVCGENP